MLREEIREKLTSVLDLERLVTKVSYGTAGARDLRAIAQTASILPDVKKMLSGISSGALKDIADGMDELGDIYELIDKSIEENPPFVVREGGMIKSGYNADVDQLRYIMSNGKDWINTAEQNEREKTGIQKLKIGYNRVFGTISKSRVRRRQNARGIYKKTDALRQGKIHNGRA